MLHNARHWILNENRLVFFYCLAAITGPAISILFAFDLSLSKDCYSYLGLSHFDFNQNPVRRYRILIPFAARLIDWLSCGLFNKLAPAYFTGDFSLPFSFFLINAMLMAYSGLLIYRYCKAYGVSTLGTVIGITTMLTCRYTTYITALPLVDSLFCVVVALSLLGIKERNTSMLIWTIFLGPFAKESFIFIAPIIFFFSHMNKKRMVVYFLLSGVLVFTYRYIYDRLAPAPIVPGIIADLYHIPNIYYQIPKLFSFSGMYKVLMNVGIWILVPIMAIFTSPQFFKKLWSSTGRYIFFFMMSVGLQMLLSGSLERMFYLSMPVVCLWIALSADEINKQYLSTEK